MKKIVAIVLILVTALSICACDSRRDMPQLRQNVGRPVTEPPTEAPTEEPTEAPTTEPIQEEEQIAVIRPYDENNRFINSTNYVGQPGQISVNVHWAVWEQGELRVNCFIINNTEKVLTGIQLDLFQVSNNEGLVARGSFPEMVAIRVEPGSYGTHTFRFLSDSVYAPNAKIDDLLTYASFSYNYEN